MKHLLLIHGGHAGGRTALLVAALARGGGACADEVELRSLPALQARIDDLLWAHGLLIATPEHFGYMSGAVKDFFDRTFYPAEGKVDGLPYALVVSAGNDGTGTVRAVERIASGYRWTRVAEPVIVVGAPDEAALRQVSDLGQTLAAGLSAGVF